MTTTQTQPIRRNNDVQAVTNRLLTYHGKAAFSRFVSSLEYDPRYLNPQFHTHRRELIQLRDKVSSYFNALALTSDPFTVDGVRVAAAFSLPQIRAQIAPMIESCGVVLALPDEPPAIVEADEFPDNLPLKTPDFLPLEKAEIALARRACFAAIHKAGLPSDTQMIRAAYSNYFNEWAGTTCSTWTAAQWRKMKNATEAPVWRNEAGRWWKIARRNGVEMKPIERKVA